MLESSFQNLVAVNRLPDPLVVQLRKFTSSLQEQGYADETGRLKVKLVTNLVQWLKRNRFAVADLDEPRVEAFLKPRHREGMGDLRTLQSFLIICEASTLFRLGTCLLIDHRWPTFSTDTKPICAPNVGLSPTPSCNTRLSFVSFSGSASAADRCFRKP